MPDEIQPVCSRCGFPVVEAGGPAGGGGWVHAEAADAAFCAIVFAAVTDG